MSLIGLDVGTVAGWCVPPDLTGEWDFTPKPPAPTKGRGPEPEGVRYRRFHDALHELLDAHPEVQAAVVEHTHSRSKRATEVLGGFIAVAEVVFELRELEYVFCPAPTLKAFARDRGVLKRPDSKGRKSLKEGMRLWAQDELGRPLTDNEADAWWLVQWLAANTVAPGSEPGPLQPTLFHVTPGVS